MSWQNTWGTVKASNAKACALYHEVSNVGKTIEQSKKRVTWRLKVEEGKEFEISLTHSLASGKKVLRVDGIVKYTAKAMSFGDWDYVFNLPGGHVVHIIIKPSVDLNDMYDLIIDGVSFRRLPDRLDANRKKDVDPYVYTGERTAPRPASNSSRENSFTPWECPSCTLVNDKPLAPVCEACGDPKPAYISAAAAMRAKAAVEKRAPAPTNRSRPLPPQQQSQAKQADLLGTDDSTFSPFGVETASAFGSAPSFDSSSATRQASNSSATKSFDKQEDITSMLSGLDFNTAPAAPQQTQSNTFADFSQAPASPNPADDATNERTASGDLWESKMVDLNLKSHQKPKPTSVKAGQTLEQARQTLSHKEKVPVMPLPAPAPVVMAAPPSQGFYATAAVPQPMGGFYQQPMVAQAAPQYGTVATGYGGYGGAGGMGMGMGQQQFMTAAAPMAAAPKKPFYGADPFATLS